MRFVLLCLGLTTAAVGREARAQEVDASAKGAARTLGYSGVEAFQRGDYATASEKLEKAFKTLQIPSLGLWSARALEKTGQLVEAAERYRQVGTMRPSGGEEDVQKKAMDDAAAELRTLQPKIPTLAVSLEGRPPAGAPVTVDGKTLPAALIGEPVPVNPGNHRVSARDGARVSEQSVTLRESEKKQLVLRFDSAPVTAGNVIESPRPAAEVRTSAPTGSVQRTLGWLTIGVGGAALVTGAVTGAIAMSKRGSFGAPDCHLDDNVCLSTRQSDVDSYNGMRHLSTAGFVAGAILAGTGAALLLTAPKADREVAVGVAGPGVVVRARF
jgi:hypothetical protein